MKRLMVAALLVLAMTSLASATVTIQLTSGANTVTIADGSGSDINAIAGKVAYSAASFNGWEIDIVAGTTHAPGLSPFGLDLTSLVAKCAAPTCTGTPLHVILSDTGFTQVTPTFQTSYSSTQTGGGSTSQSAYFSAANTLFAEPAGGLIGTIGPFNGAGAFAGTAQGGGPAGPAAYALTIDQVFNSNGTAVSFSADGNITAIPEPASMALFGTVLVLCASKLRKRLS